MCEVCERLDDRLESARTDLGVNVVAAYWSDEATERHGWVASLSGGTTLENPPDVSDQELVRLFVIRAAVTAAMQSHEETVLRLTEIVTALTLLDEPGALIDAMSDIIRAAEMSARGVEKSDRPEWADEVPDFLKDDNPEWH